MNIIHIVAAAENNAIGKDNQLLWHLPRDMKFFKETTIGHCIISGRKNYDSIPDRFRPLSNRTNIVVTRNKNFSSEGAIVVNDIHSALEVARGKGETDCYIIGGAEIYRQTMDDINIILLTKVHHSFDADAFYPALNMNDWNIISQNHFDADEKNKYAMTFLKLIRK